MKLLAINGSPRPQWNTGQLLEQVVAGARSAEAEAELVQLGKLDFRGCISCFACKRIGGPSYGRCVLNDDAKPVLQKAHEADVLVFGSPIYLGTETAMMRAFLERLYFQYLLYSKIKQPLAPRKKATAFVYTMNVSQGQLHATGMDKNIIMTKMLIERMFSPCEILYSYDTLQFDDYSLYDNDMWDVPAKLKRHEEVFPQDLRHAFAMGARLVT